LRSGAPATTIHDIQFRVGVIAFEVEPTHKSPPNRPALYGDAKSLHSPTRVRRTGPRSRSQPGHGSGLDSGQP
jgi:hypothetical protein